MDRSPPNFFSIGNRVSPPIQTPSQNINKSTHLKRFLTSFPNLKLTKQAKHEISLNLQNISLKNLQINKEAKKNNHTIHNIQSNASSENLKKMQDEIVRLEYLNNFLTLSLQKRDEMLAHLMEENRKLKELTVFFERTFASLNKTHTLSPRKKNKRSSISNEIYSNKSNIKSFNNLNLAFDEKNSFHQSKKRSDPQQKRNIQFLLNLNTTLADMNSIYHQDENIQYVKNLLENEDDFITTVSNFDYQSLLSFYDSLKSLFMDHHSLFFLIHQLLKIIKAANSMSESSMVLTEAMEKIVNETCECLNCDRASVFLFDHEKDELWSKVAKGYGYTLRIPKNSGIVGYVATTGEPLNIVNAYSDDRFNKEVDKKTNYKTNTILCVPIFNKTGQILGVSQAINKLDGVFTKEDEGLLNLLSNLAGIILKNSLQYDEEMMLFNNLRHVLKSGIYLNSFLDLENLLRNAEKKLSDMMNVEEARIFLIDLNKKMFRRFLENGQTKEFPLKIGLVGHCYESGEYLAVSNGYTSSLFNGIIDIETSLPLICIPIIHPSNLNEIIGVFQVINPKGLGNKTVSKSKKNQINPYELEILEYFSQQLAQIIIKILEWGKIAHKENENSERCFTDYGLLEIIKSPKFRK